MNEIQKQNIITKLLSGLFLIFTLLLGQNDECATITPETDVRLQYFTIQELRTLTERTDRNFHITVKTHIVTLDNGTGGIDISDVNIAYSDAQGIFDDNESGIILNVEDEIDYINETNYYYLTTSESYDLMDLNDEDYRIDIFFVESFTYNGYQICGQAQGIAQETDIVVNNSCATNTSTLAHEIGHNLALYHTHELMYGAENVERDDEEPCFNCESAGDKICDTDADPRLISSGSNQNVDNNCNYYGNLNDNCQTPVLYSPDTQFIVIFTKTMQRFPKYISNSYYAGNDY